MSKTAAIGSPPHSITTVVPVSVAGVIGSGVWGSTACVRFQTRKWLRGMPACLSTSQRRWTPAPSAWVPETWLSEKTDPR